MEEYLYLAVNKSMPGLLKVGYTTRKPRDRLRELHTTGVPTPFRYVAVLKVPVGAAAERAAHKALDRFRKDRSREFFKVTPGIAVPIVLKVMDNYEIDWSNTPNTLGIVEIDNLKRLHLAEEDKNERQRRALELAGLHRQLRALDAEIKALTHERSRLGTKPAPYKWSSLETLTFFLSWPLPFGWILWGPAIIWILDPKRQDWGVWCFIAIAVMFAIWYSLHEGEKKHTALTKPFAAIEEKIAKATSSRDELLSKRNRLGFK